MNNSCTKCGAALDAGQVFCSACGARRTDPNATPAAQQFCRSCGNALTSDSKFCVKCGTPAGQIAAKVVAPSPAPPPVSPPQVPASTHVQNVSSAPPATPTAPPKKSPLFKIIMAVIAFLVLIAVCALAGLVYVGYRAKKKANEIQQAYKTNDPAALVNALTGKKSESKVAAQLPGWKPAPTDLASSPAGKVPLKVSLHVVRVGNDEIKGDYESIFELDSANEESMHIKASEQFPGPQGGPMGQQGKSQSLQKISCGRTVLRVDQENATDDDGFFCRNGREEKRSGTTGLGMSKKNLLELRATGQTEFTFHEDPMRVLFKSFKDAVNGGGSTDLSKAILDMAPGSHPTPTPPINCIFRRVESTDLAFPVLVNDQSAELPAVHTVCVRPDSGEEVHVYLLDDPDNPMVLAVHSGTGGNRQITKIYWKADEQQPANPIEQQLEQNGRAKTYGIYFDFDSDVLRPESQAVLTEIAQAMQTHPDWKLNVEGHSDNVGGDDHNLDLSNRRAAAVKTELVSTYHADASRLATSGFGASRPVAPNDTMEGRALNRRVELVRQ